MLIALLSDTPDLTLIEDPALWATARANAQRHGVAQLLASVARAHVSGAERAWCDHVLTRSWTRHDKNLADLEFVTGILRHAGIRSLALKGALLARRHYHPPFLRKTSGDVDLAIRDCDLEKACEAFSLAGYQPSCSLREARARSHHVELNHVELIHTGSNQPRPHLELHFRLSHGAYGIPVDEFFERAVRQKIPGGGDAEVLSPSDELLHLVLHRAHGRFALLFHLLEIRRIWLAAAPPIREEVLRAAARHHFAGAFWLTDVAFRHYWGEPFLLPGMLPLTWLQSRINGELYNKFEALSEPGRTLPLGVRLARRWVDFQLTDRPADALRFARVLLRVTWYQLLRGGWRTVKID